MTERPKPRQGYYVGGALMGVVSQNWDKGDGLGIGGGLGNSIRLGQLITRRFGMGLQIDSGSVKSKHVQSTLFNLGLELHWEVLPNVVTHGGIGLGVSSVKDDRDPDAGLRGAFGTCYALGLSYDWFPNKQRLSGGWAISPRVMARFIPGGDINAVGLLVGIELSYWTGLPRNQLELPEADAYKK